MLQTLNSNTINNNNNNAMYINPKKKVLSKWCANHGLSPNTSSMMVVNTTTTSSNSIKKMEDTSCTFPTNTTTTTTASTNTTSSYSSLHTPSVPHLSFPSQPSLTNLSSSWNVAFLDDSYFKRNNYQLSTSISLTYSRDDTSCLEPQNGGIVLYSSLRYLLKHDFKLTSSATNANLPQILFMNVDLVGGTIKEKINGVISCNPELSTDSNRVFQADSRLQIEKVQSYKQAVHFKLSLFDLSDLKNAICVLDSVSFNVFARKKQEGSVSPKIKKTPTTKNVATKRRLSSSSTDDVENLKLSKQPKVEDTFSNSVSNTVSYAIQSFVNTAVAGPTTTVANAAADIHLSDGSLSLLANVLTNPSNYLDDDEEQDHNLEIDDGEEQTTTNHHDNQLLCTYEHQLKELMKHISLLSNEERAIALQSAIVALR